MHLLIRAFFAERKSKTSPLSFSCVELSTRFVISQLLVRERLKLEDAS